jgi:hypothetical protein
MVGAFTIIWLFEFFFFFDFFKRLVVHRRLLTIDSKMLSCCGLIGFFINLLFVFVRSGRNKFNNSVITLVAVRFGYLVHGSLMEGILDKIYCISVNGAIIRIVWN